jgi:hypothetical protein
VAVDEAKRRGRSPPKVEPKPPDEPKRTQVDLATGSLTRGQVNAVRAAYKAGVTLSQIARQFGISQSNIRKVLTADNHDKKEEVRGWGLAVFRPHLYRFDLIGDCPALSRGGLGHMSDTELLLKPKAAEQAVGVVS